MSTVELQKDIAASLYIVPATLEELMKRDFLENRSEYGVNILLKIMIDKRWIYKKGDVYHTYRKFAESSKMSDYELHGIHDKPTRKSAEEVIKEWNKEDG